MMEPRLVEPGSQISCGKETPLNRFGLLGVVFFGCVAVFATAMGQESKSLPEDSEEGVLDSAELFEVLIGKWEGTCKTWFRPGPPSDSSPVREEFETVVNSQFLRHTYKGSIQGQERVGEETIVFHSIKSQYQVTWIDTFHMNYGIMVSAGKINCSRFSRDR